MQNIEVARRFPAPVDRVWDLYTDHANWSEWAGVPQSWLEKEGSPDRNGTGCVRGLGLRSVPGAAVFEEVLEWQPKQRFTYRIVSGGFPLRDHWGEVLFQPEGEDGTLVTWRCRFDSRIPGLGPVLKRILENRVFRGGLEGLSRRYFAGK